MNFTTKTKIWLARKSVYWSQPTLWLSDYHNFSATQYNLKLGCNDVRLWAKFHKSGWVWVNFLAKEFSMNFFTTKTKIRLVRKSVYWSQPNLWLSDYRNFSMTQYNLEFGWCKSLSKVSQVRLSLSEFFSKRVFNEFLHDKNKIRLARKSVYLDVRVEFVRHKKWSQPTLWLSQLLYDTI